MNAKEIVTKTFEKAKLGGYKIEEVDEFLRDVSVEFKKLRNENEELEKKLEVLAEKIREYRKDEDAIRDALLSAKKEGIAIVKEAKEQAEKINKEAKEKAEKTIKDADELAAKKKRQGEEELEAAREKAKNTIDNANAKSDEIHSVMTQRTEREQIVLQRIRKEVEEYSAKLVSAYNAQIEVIKAIPRQCENEFIISTAKEAEARKPADSAFAKQIAEKEKAKKEQPKAEVKFEVKEEAKTEEKKSEAEEKQAEKTDKASGSVLFSLKGEKEEKNTEVLEFGKNA